MQVYLCGSITTDPRCLEWRERVCSHFVDSYDVEIVDPCRKKNSDEWTPDGFEAASTVYADGAFLARDRRDIEKCDVLLLCWWGDPGRQSIGTWCEFGWATAIGKPVVFVDLTEDGYNLRHPFVYRQVAAKFRSLEEACD